jgi:hypothetical protein
MWEGWAATSIPTPTDLLTGAGDEPLKARECPGLGV